ncbi:hypothetical protein VitviT2T_004624 [Vitis vinifera]|uniref:Uncharacterized protein n=2 Tax=Vitis vinifera TaxID=29760 RepID=A0ABY9BRC9_VITVI|eukprot:XP_002281176.1 PREDICTED: uncharacterized protein LOC100249040 [Vitis vinifera]
MASRYRSLSKPTLSLLKSTITKTKLSNPTPLLCTPGASPTLPRSFSQIRCLQSLLPLHTAVSSARLTSCLGIDSSSSRSLSQELGLSVPR